MSNAEVLGVLAAIGLAIMLFVFLLAVAARVAEKDDDDQEGGDFAA